jgi:hypothetical protein
MSTWKYDFLAKTLFCTFLHEGAAKFKMNQKKKKIRRIQDFRHHFFAGETEIKINFDIITEKQ